MENETMDTQPEQTPAESSANALIRQIAGWVIAATLLFGLGLGSGYLTWGKGNRQNDNNVADLHDQINPKDGYTLPIAYGDLGPQLLKSGVIDYDRFAAIYADAGNPLSAEQVEILKNGSDQEIVISTENAHFLLNYFWAVGLVNNNPILTQGPIVQNSEGQVERFASTGGWTLANKPIMELYSSVDLVPLTLEQQARVEEVAAGVYRPCCNNPTHFPDCNHGMAMLGILELMASQGASTNEMFEAAKYINAYWFPQQTLEMALYLKANHDIDFVDADAKLVVGSQLSSSSGAQMVHADLQSKGLLQQAPGQGGSCAN
jgi:hypothetical protein